jgi:periplasmic divalent cation tolerance protein
MNRSAAAAVVVLTTVGADVDAAALARTLVEERLAACVSILPVMRSIYRWRNAIEDDREQQLLMKTSAERIDALRTRVLELHPYETPEWLVLDAAASEAYARWVGESTTRE